ncbi:MAG: hypothetical protein SchgKO_05650 [Schleiferiaceae bacterium]
MKTLIKIFVLGSLLIGSFLARGQEILENYTYLVVDNDTLIGTYKDHKIDNGSFSQYQKFVFNCPTPPRYESCDPTYSPTSNPIIFENLILTGQFKNGKPTGKWVDHGKCLAVDCDNYPPCTLPFEYRVIHFLQDTVKVVSEINWFDSFEINFIADSTELLMKSTSKTVAFYAKCPQGQICEFGSSDSDIPLGTFPREDWDIIEDILRYAYAKDPSNVKKELYWYGVLKEDEEE